MRRAMIGLAAALLGAAPWLAQGAPKKGFTLVMLPGTVHEGAKMCRYPMGTPPECYTMTETKTGSVRSVHMPDGTTLMEIDGQGFLFHVPDVSVTYRDCFMPLSAYLKRKDHSLLKCSNYTPGQG